MGDGGFLIQELCALRGIILNRPKQKESEQFVERDVATNIDITATQIHVEHFIGRVLGNIEFHLANKHGKLLHIL